MINDIINGITATIGKEFGDHEIYVENIEQGLKEPCFFVKTLDVSQQKYIGNRYLLTVPLDVHYFPARKKKRTEMHDAAMRLQYILERITMLNGEMVNGVKAHYEIVDDVLHYFITYKMVVKYSTDPVDNMGNLAIDSHMKGDE